MELSINIFSVISAAIIISYMLFLTYNYFKGNIFLTISKPIAIFILIISIMNTFLCFFSGSNALILNSSIIMLLFFNPSLLFILNNYLLVQNNKIRFSNIENLIILKTESACFLKITTTKKTITSDFSNNNISINKLKTLLESKNIPFQLKQAKTNT